MQKWSVDDARNWLVDETDAGTPEVVMAFLVHSVDGQALSVLVGPNELLAEHTLGAMDLPLDAVKPLVEIVERYAYPAGLGSPPAHRSCSRLGKPIVVRQSITITDLYIVDDVVSLQLLSFFL